MLFTNCLNSLVDSNGVDALIILTLSCNGVDALIILTLSCNGVDALIILTLSCNFVPALIILTLSCNGVPALIIMTLSCNGVHALVILTLSCNGVHALIILTLSCNNCVPDHTSRKYVYTNINCEHENIRFVKHNFLLWIWHYNCNIKTFCQFKSGNSQIIYNKMRENVNASIRYEWCAQNESRSSEWPWNFEYRACAELQIF